MAYDLAKQHFSTQDKDERAKRMPLNLNSFTKYDGKTSPEAFVHSFESELALCGMTDEAEKLKIFPSLLTSSRAHMIVEKLRACSTWKSM